VPRPSANKILRFEKFIMVADGHLENPKNHDISKTFLPISAEFYY